MSRTISCALSIAFGTLVAIVQHVSSFDQNDIVQGASSYDGSISILDMARVTAVVQIRTLDLDFCAKTPRDPRFCENSDEPLDWQPKPGKYLFAFCAYGQLSNRAYCLRKNMMLAAILQRTLIVQETGYEEWHYNLSSIVDAEHANSCLGGRRIIRLKEYFKLENKTEMELHFPCWSTDTHNGCEKKYEDQFKQEKVKISNEGICWHSSVNLDTRKADFLNTYSKMVSSVISLGNIYFSTFNDSNVLKLAVDTAFGLSGDCRAIFRPDRHLIDSAQKYVNQYLGPNFVGIHLRRGDFYFHCLYFHLDRCFPAVAQVAVCLAGAIMKLPSVDNRIILLASNGNDDELSFLKRSLGSLLKSERFEIVNAGGMNEENFMMAHSITDEASKLTFLKIVLAKAEMVYGYFGSTFTQDIFTIRGGLKGLTPFDGFCLHFKQFGNVTFETLIDEK